jgi:hypothetical protein
MIFFGVSWTNESDWRPLLYSLVELSRRKAVDLPWGSEWPPGNVFARPRWLHHPSQNVAGVQSSIGVSPVSDTKGID